MEQEQKKEMGYAKDRELFITGIEIDTNQYNTNEIRKITFNTDVGPITWKPKVKKVQLMDGIKINKVKPMEIGDLPKEVSEIGEQINNLGKVKAIVEYTTMKVDQDGQEKTYRFIRSIETLKKWELQKITTPQEDVITE